MLILCRSREEAEATLAKAKELLEMLKFRLSEEKTKVSSCAEGFDFLGFHFTARHVGVGKKSLKGFYAKAREMTRRQQGGVPLAEIIEQVNPMLRGWANYHREGNNSGLPGTGQIGSQPDKGI